MPDEGNADKEAKPPDDWELSRDWWNALTPRARRDFADAHNGSSFARDFGYVIRTGSEPYMAAFVKGEWERAYR